MASDRLYDEQLVLFDGARFALVPCGCMSDVVDRRGDMCCAFCGWCDTCINERGDCGCPPDGQAYPF